MLQSETLSIIGASTTDAGVAGLGLVAVLFLGLPAWWLSKVFLNRPRQPKPIGKPMRANTLQGERNALQRNFDKS